jgi:hypothetical protein
MSKMYFNSLTARAAALFLVASVLAACGGGGSSGPASPPPPPTNAAPRVSNVAVSGGAVPGLQLTGSYTYSDAEGDAQGNSTFRWLRSASSSGAAQVAISGAVARTYTVVAADEGSYLFFCVTPVASNGTSPGLEVCAGTTAAVPVSGNTVTVLVDAGPANSGYVVNRLFASVTVCRPGSITQCQTIDHVLVDSGSTGLRLLSSSNLAALSLPKVTGNTGFPILSCVQFVDNTFAWGPVASADIVLGRKTASSVPIQLIADPAYARPATGCSAGGTSITTAAALGANGIIGLGLFKDDCGSNCAITTHNGSYFTCTDPSCSSPVGAAVSIAKQVQNPVPLFGQDNNGIVIDLPAVGTTTSGTLSGTLIFGIGTQTNNQLATGKVLTTNATGNFTTTLVGQNYTTSFLDSGSNGLFFDSAMIATCTDGSVGFYCPPSRTSLSATLVGANAASSTVSFSIDNATSLFADSSQHVLPTLSGPFGDSTSFDWGLPFFYGRRVFIGIDGQPSSIGTGPFYAF